MQDMSQKELLVRLMDEVSEMKREQITHHTYAQAKLESIEAQALKTNGRVTKNEIDITEMKGDIGKAKVVFTTLSVLLSAMWAIVTFVFK